VFHQSPLCLRARAVHDRCLIVETELACDHLYLCPPDRRHVQANAESIALGHREEHLGARLSRRRDDLTANMRRLRSSRSSS